MWNMRIARTHLPLARQKLNSFPESFHLRVMVYTGAGGSLMVEGYVPSPEDEQRVREAIEQTKPPVKVVYQVHVVGTNVVSETK